MLRRLAFTTGATAAAIATVLLLGGSAANAAPASPGFAAAIDGYAAYDPQDTCSPTEKPGPRALRAMLNKAYGLSRTGNITRDCSDGDTSEHKEGRALDYMLNINNSTERGYANDVLNWMLATDQHGNRHAVARRLGIMYIIWNRQIWSSYNASDGWRAYGGSNPHTDHIHFSFSWAGARKQTTWWGGGIARRDWDSDGDVDIIARNAATKDLHLYRGNGSGGFQSGTGAAFSNNWSAFDIVFNAGDFDGDTDPDVIARNATTKDLHLYRGNGSGGFQSGTGAAFSNNWSAFDMIIPAGDFDRDGDADLIARNAATKDLHLYRGNGAGGFQSGTGAAFSNNWSAFDLIFAAGDFDRDGDVDLIGRAAASKDLHLYRGNGAGGFQSGTGAAFSNNWSAFDMIFVAADFDRDGDPDVIARNATTKDLHLYRGNGSGGFQSGTGAAFSNNWSAFDRLL